METCLDLDALTNDDEFSLAISAFSKDIFHLGLFCKKDEDRCIIHLMDHMDLRRSSSFQHYKYLKLSSIDDEEAIHLVAAAEATYNSNKCGIPFGPCGGGSLDEANSFVGEGGDGLTCSLFVLAFLEQQGINLIDKDTWPIREQDTAMQLELIGNLKIEHCRLPEDIELFEIQEARARAGVPRYRPEEVGASALIEQIPVAFQDIQERSAQIAQYLVGINESH
ncbi:hypothetical protein RFA42_000792 [Vibrio vulnificus]|uniref:hypothetical protein n=1 Tax=Vibrio vulnificus TaxID=672 RepID=UPI001CDC5302|nr:hypothetical protein [Vibrio vulnificus]EKZ9200066.1 hypothetical protein [Vibrio vulnificus]MCA3974465.1 hypothetical protein [Vibrio vulnificus]HDY7666235.1 hypothetical protein [Vibrio vulnificus]HDY7671587.1 hypothetical protein [Vibrio vulnificus]HDY7853931.1 hypothetical protein [Vibrio vulnificus]